MPWGQIGTLGANYFQRFSHVLYLLCPKDSLREPKIWGVQIVILQREEKERFAESGVGHLHCQQLVGFSKFLPMDADRGPSCCK